jgi:hypothetical protein
VASSDPFLSSTVRGGHHQTEGASAGAGAGAGASSSQSKPQSKKKAAAKGRKLREVDVEEDEVV